MQILVKTLTGKTIAVSVKLTDTVTFMTQRMQYKETVSLDYQYLIFTRKHLMEHHTFGNSSIQEESTFHMELCF